MSKPGVYVTNDKTAAALRGLKSLVGKDVLVGIPSEKGPRGGDEMSNAVLGYIHETGAPEVNIPERPFLLPGVRDASKQVAALLKRGAQAAMAGDTARVDRALHAAGIAATNAVKRKITVGPFAPLAPSTIKRRQRRTKGSSYRRSASSAADVKPLIDTGQLRQSITYVVRSKK